MHALSDDWGFILVQVILSEVFYLGVVYMLYTLNAKR